MLKERRDIPKKDPDGSSGGGWGTFLLLSVSVGYRFHELSFKCCLGVA